MPVLPLYLLGQYQFTIVNGHDFVKNQYFLGERGTFFGDVGKHGYIRCQCDKIQIRKRTAFGDFDCLTDPIWYAKDQVDSAMGKSAKKDPVGDGARKRDSTLAGNLISPFDSLPRRYSTRLRKCPIGNVAVHYVTFPQSRLGVILKKMTRPAGSVSRLVTSPAISANR